jgi:3-oxoacyl-[acyl-carrier protein] reductase
VARGEHAGEIAVVTGGARGLGKAFGTALAGEGAHVVLVDLDGAAAAAAAEEIMAAGGSAEGVACDVAHDAQVAPIFEGVGARRGGVDILVNNAGLYAGTYTGTLAEMGLEQARRLFDVNLMGVLACSLAARPAMQGRPNASIINIASAAAYTCRTTYGVTKLGVRGLTILLAHELAEEGIRVNGIAPGLIPTETVRRTLPDAAAANVKANQFLARAGEEKDIVDTLLHLVSRRATFVTGETLRVTGGYTLAI